MKLIIFCLILSATLFIILGIEKFKLRKRQLLALIPLLLLLLLFSIYLFLPLIKTNTSHINNLPKLEVVTIYDSLSVNQSLYKIINTNDNLNDYILTQKLIQRNKQTQITNIQNLKNSQLIKMDLIYNNPIYKKPVSKKINLKINTKYNPITILAASTTLLMQNINKLILQ